MAAGNPKKFKASCIAACIILAATCLYVLEFIYNDYYIGTYMDDANYIILAESIAEGHGYKQINYPTAPLETRYPPGLPFVLAPLVTFAWDNLNILKIPSVVTTLLAVFVAWRLFKLWRIEDRVALVSLALFAFNPLVVGLSVWVMSESLFLLVLLLTVWSLERGNRSNQTGYAQGLGWMVAAACLGGAASLIRTTGLLLLPAGGLWLANQRRWRSLLTFGLVFVVGVLPWMFRNITVTGTLISAEYERQLTWQSSIDPTPVQIGPDSFVERVTSNLGAYVGSDLADALVPSFGQRTREAFKRLGIGQVSNLAGIVLCGILIYGFIRLRQVKGLGPLEWFLLLYASLLMVWPFPQARFLHPIVPLLCLALVYALKGILKAIPLPATVRVSRVLVPILLPLLALYLYRDSLMMLDPIALQTTNLEAGSEYIREYASKDVVVMVPHPMAWYVHLHRQTVPYPQPGSLGAEILNDISESKVAYILISRPLAIPRPINLDPFVAEVLVPLLRSQPDRFHQVYDDPQNDVTIYQVISH